MLDLATIYPRPILIILILQLTTAFEAKPQTPKRIVFSPATFSHSFSANIPPALTIHAGDTIVTETIDAMGYDKSGVKRTYGGDPLTGPFLVEEAKPGDILVITLHDISLNRDYAKTSESLAGRSMPKEIARQFKKSRLIKWKLDRKTMTASPDSPVQDYPHIRSFTIPLHPFSGCLGVAPDNRKKEILSFFQGPFGGNMDYKEIKTGATIYLPIFHEGAYLYIGDGHAAQGDGEIAGNALETSMHVEFSVKIIAKDSGNIQYPRIENEEYKIALGTAKEIPDALRIAGNNLLEWLQKDYNLTLQEATQVLSTGIEYTIAEIADPEVVVAAKIKKSLLTTIRTQ